MFNTVINTLVDSLKSCAELGYTLAPKYTVSVLQYADDTCLVAKSPAACQVLLNRAEQWLKWSMMKPKVPKCHSVAIQSSSGKVIDPQLTIANKEIPFMGNKSIKFLGMRIEFPMNTAAAKQELEQKLESMLHAVDKTPLTSQQKLKTYRQGVCPRLNWLLLIYEYPFTWIEKLDALATKYLKRWAGLARSANPNVLFLPTRASIFHQYPPSTRVSR